MPTHILPIKKEPDKILRQKAKPVAVDELHTRETQQLIDNMIATMYEADGVGIAAPQVGVSLRIAIVTDGDKAIPIINPKITLRSLTKDTQEEGCLSVPLLYGPVKRSTSLRLTALTRDGKKISLRARGFLARIIQHEVDHLNGILFIDRAKSVFRIDGSTKL